MWAGLQAVVEGVVAAGAPVGGSAAADRTAGIGLLALGLRRLFWHEGWLEKAGVDSDTDAEIIILVVVGEIGVGQCAQCRAGFATLPELFIQTSPQV